MTRKLIPLLALLALPAFPVTCPSGVTHIQDTLITGDGVTPAYGKINISGPSAPSGSVLATSTGVTIATITAGQAAAGVPNVDFCLVGGVAARYQVNYKLTTSTGRSLNSYSEVWFVPVTTAALKISQLWGGLSAPQFLTSWNQMNPAGYAIGQVPTFDGNTFSPGSGGGSGGDGTWGGGAGATTTWGGN